MSEIVEHDRVTLSWRESYEEQVERGFQRRKRELAEYKAREAEERERRERERAQAKAREAKQQVATNNSEASQVAIDARIKFWFDHYFDGLGKGNDYRGLYADEIAKALAGLRRQLHDGFKRAVEEERRSFEAKLAEQRERFLASNSQATWVGWV